MAQNSPSHFGGYREMWREGFSGVQAHVFRIVTSIDGLWAAALGKNTCKTNADGAK